MAAEKVVKSVILSIAVILVLLWASDVAGRYRVDATVDSVNYYGYVTFKLRNGQLVTTYPDGEYVEGDKVVLTMDDNATEYNTDDDFIVAVERREQ